jgi:hypothetical protein
VVISVDDALLQQDAPARLVEDQCLDQRLDPVNADVQAA